MELINAAIYILCIDIMRVLGNCKFFSSISALSVFKNHSLRIVININTSVNKSADVGCEISFVMQSPCSLCRLFLDGYIV